MIANPTGHNWQERHPDIDVEWVERTLVSPEYFEEVTDIRDIYYGKLPEVGNWLKVVVENSQLHTAYRDRRLIKRWGKP